MAFFDDINEEEPKLGQSSSTKNDTTEDNNVSDGKDMPPHHETDLEDEPKIPAITFTYDHKTNKLQIRDRRGSVKAEFSVMPINGASAYDLWKENHKNEPDTSYNAYVKDITGKDGANGKNGKNAYEEWKEWEGSGKDKSKEAYWEFFKGEKGQSAFELWKAVHGEKENSTPDDFFEYLKGQDGKDAFEVWQDMGYKNSTREDFFKWIAGLVETQKGEDGKIYYPHFDGYTLYFTEDLEGKGTRLTEKDIRGKDGRTFTPKFEGTKLHFEDGEGEKTEEVDLRGKNAYELWLENGHEGASYEDYIKFFSGHVVCKKYGYKDIVDFNPDVQYVNRHLLSDKDTMDSSLNAEQYCLYRKQEIEDIREEGRKIRGDWFQEIFWWCSGADKSILRVCPADHSKYVGIGTVILFTALMAFFSSFTAMNLVFQDSTKHDFNLMWILAGIGCAAALICAIHYGINRTTTIAYEDKNNPSGSGNLNGAEVPNNSKDPLNNKRKKVVTTTSKTWGLWLTAILFVGILIAICCDAIKLSTPKILIVQRHIGFALVFAMFWSMMIFFLDRFITNTMYSDGKTTISWLEFRSGLPRIIISIFLGIVISAPLELKIFEDNINLEMDKQYVQELDAEIERARKIANAQYENDIEYLQSLKSSVQGERENANADLTSLGECPQSDWQLRTNNNGDTIPYDASKKQKEIYLKEQKRITLRRDSLNDRIDNLNGVINRKMTDKDGEITNKTDSAKALFKRRFDRGLSRQLKTLHAIAMEGYAPLFPKDSINDLSQNISQKDVAKDTTSLAKQVNDTANVSVTQSNTNTFQDDAVSKKRIDLHTNEGKDKILKCSLSVIFFLIFLLLFCKRERKKREENGEEYSLNSSSCWLKNITLLNILLSILLGCLIGFNYETIHALGYYFTTPIGMIMLLFILIDVSPVFYKMMLADGRYDKLLHQDKLIEQDLIRLRVAKSIQKVNESELSSLAPFVFGEKVFRKIKKSFSEERLQIEKLKDDGFFKGDESEYKKRIKALDAKERGQSQALELYDPNDEESQALKQKNKELFQRVLGMKTRIVDASYAAWYRNMFDLKLGYEDSDEGKEDNPEIIRTGFVLSFVCAPEIGGNIEVTPQKNIYFEGDEIKITATPHDEYIFAGWRDGLSEQAERTIKVTEDKIFVAYFKKQS